MPWVHTNLGEKSKVGIRNPVHKCEQENIGLPKRPRWPRIM